MTGALVDLLHGLLVRRLAEAPHEPGRRVRPGVLEVDLLVVLDREVGVVRLHQAVGGDPLHPAMHVHELWHVAPFRRCRHGSYRTVGRRRNAVDQAGDHETNSPSETTTGA